MKKILTMTAIALSLMVPTLASAHENHGKGHNHDSHQHDDNRDGMKHKKHKKHKKNKHYTTTHETVIHHHHIDEVERIRTIELNKNFYIKLP